MHFTIDFWQTLYDSSNGEARNRERREVLWEAIEVENGATADRKAFEEAYTGLWGFFDKHWLGRQRTPTSDEMVGEILRRTDAHLSLKRRKRVVEIFEQGILHHPPALLPGAREGVEFLASKGPLALISDTAFSPGAVLRELMERDGVADYFRTFIFSDETGVAKPHPEAFLKALQGLGARPDMATHIGDIERTDIVGARGVGMQAILYRTPDRQHKYAEEETVADRVMESWWEVEGVVRRS